MPVRAAAAAEAVFLIEDESGDLEEFVGHLALLHRAAEQFEFGVVRKECRGDGRTERRRFILPARGAAGISLAIIATRTSGRTITTGAARAAGAIATGAAALSITRRTTAIAAGAVAETRAVAIATRAAVAGADLLGRAADPLRAKTKGGEVQFEGLFLWRVVFGRVGGH